MKYFVTLFFLITFFLFSLSCKKDNFAYENEGKLTFSADTVLFDTVFTTVGSTTKALKIYNPHNKSIKISSIQLGGTQASMFKLNIDGTPTHEISNIDLAAKDSLYIFVRITVNPNSSNTPFVVNDSIIFVTNEHVQSVKLVAWGQNAYYHTPTHFPYNMSPYSIISSNTTWSNDKPHLIYGWLVIDSSYTLTIPEGTQIHFHNNSGIWVYKDASLKVEGSLQSPVVFQGDRLEAWYKDLPGQWGRLMYNGYLYSMGIWLSSGSKENEINYAIIRNGDTGIKVDTLGSSALPTLKIKNTIIENMSTAGLYAQGSYIEGENLLISNIGIHSLILSIGGSYDFKHCTFANYWSYSNRQTSSVVINNYYKDIYNNIQLRPLTKAYFGNCIIYGPIEEELNIDINPQIIHNYQFDYCLLRTKEDINNTTHFNNCIKNLHPQFENSSENNYKLSNNSPALNIGSLTIAAFVPNDLLGINRLSSPDLGAYEKE